MDLIEVRGKSTRTLRKVFVLITKEMATCVDFLIETRKHGDNNPYLFARKLSKSPLDGCTAMRVVTASCPSLKNPLSIRSTKLRRYLATTAQVITY